MHWLTSEKLTISSFTKAHPLACAAALAVQNVIESENLLENCRTTGSLLKKQLQEALSGPNTLASPYVFDIRGQGGFWAIEFDVDSDSAPRLDLKGQRFAMLVQARALHNDLIVMGFTGGSELAGVRGDHIVLAPVSLFEEVLLYRVSLIQPSSLLSHTM